MLFMSKKNLAKIGITILAVVFSSVVIYLLFMHEQDKDLYENKEYGFQLELPRGIYEVEEEYGDGPNNVCIFFNIKKINDANQGYNGTVFRIEIIDKTENNRFEESIQARTDAYGLRILLENDRFIVGWAKATDVQYPHEYAEYYQTISAQADDIIEKMKWE